MRKKMKNIQKAAIALSLVTFFLASGFDPAAQARQEEQGEEVIRITQVDTSQFPQVTLYVSITDAAGNPIGVSPSNIIIEENGVPIPLDQIHGVGEVGPLTTLLVMDVSGSMHTDGKLEAAKAAAHSFIDQMRAEDQFGLLTFSTEITYAQPITTGTTNSNPLYSILHAPRPEPHKNQKNPKPAFPKSLPLTNTQANYSFFRLRQSYFDK